MRKALRRPLCLSLTLIVLSGLAQRAFAQQSDSNAVHSRPRTVDVLMVPPAFGSELIRPPFAFGLAAESASLLEAVILTKLGSPYKFFGTDNRGFDCSGFVWRVFQEAGVKIDRMPARALWQLLPEASPREWTQLGTLVFFNGLTHVGIVRDAFSFYHASRSQGVVLSFFAGYWEKRITGYRSSPRPTMISDDSRAPVSGLSNDQR